MPYDCGKVLKIIINIMISNQISEPQFDKITSHGSGVSVVSFASFCSGDIDPTLNKKIHELISSTDSYMVYLDDNFSVQWTWTDNYGEDPTGFAEIASRIGYLETLSVTQLSHGQLELFERLLAEGMARIVGEKDFESARKSLNEAETYLHARGSENARIWYLEGSAKVACTLSLAAIVLWFLKSYLIALVGTEVITVIMGMCIGGIGAFLSILYRSEKIPMEPSAGKSVHVIEGGAKTVAGCLGALLMVLAIKANLVLGIIQPQFQFASILVMCFCAGFSALLVKGFIKKVGVEEIVK